MTQAPMSGQPDQKKKKPQKQGSWIGTIIFLLFVLARPALSLLKNIQGMGGTVQLILLGIAALVGVGVIVALVVRRINTGGPAAPDIAQYTARSSYTAPSVPRSPAPMRMPPPSPMPRPPQFEPVASRPVILVGVAGLVLLGMLALILLSTQAGI